MMWQASHGDDAFAVGEELSCVFVVRESGFKVGINNFSPNRLTGGGKKRRKKSSALC